MPLDAKQYYLIRSTDGASVFCRRADAAPKLTGGGARYNVINRARRTSTIQWDGDDPYTMDVPILLDGWMSHTSVEIAVAMLNQMRQSQSELTPPVRVFVDGAVPVKGATWVIQGIDWGDLVIWTADNFGKGYRLRQDAVIHLLQYVQPTVLTVTTPNTGHAVHVKAGQTVAKLAKTHNTTTSAILKANNIRDSKTVKSNTRLIIPTKAGAFGAAGTSFIDQPGPTDSTSITPSTTDQTDTTHVFRHR